ncbi:MAG: hypothetical protein QM756_37810 [Polyangiaceae bacterium]
MIARFKPWAVLRWCPSALFLLACHSQTPAVDAQAPVASARTPRPSERKLDVPALRATELGRVQNGTFGPYLGMRADGALVVWAALDKGERTFSAAALTKEGLPLARAGTLGNAPHQLGVVAVRPMRDGYALLFTRQGDKSEHVEALCVSDKAEARGAANPLAELNGRALWVELVAVEQGALAFYAVRGGDKQKAEVWAVAIDSQCRPVERTLVFKNALAWQAAAAPKGAFLSAVQPADALGGLVSVAVLDGNAKLKTTTRVTPESGADPDLDAVSLGERALLAWTDKRRPDPSVVSAVLDASGKLLAPPERLTPPEGEQALLRLVTSGAGGKQAFVAWERLEARPGSGRYFSLSAVNEQGRTTGARVELGYANDDGGIPELAAAGDGLAALTLAPQCRRGSNCDGSDIAPTYVRFDAALRPLETEPLRLEPLSGGRAELGFGLGCWQAGCVAISALSSVPAPIFATRLEQRSREWAAPLRELPNDAVPRVKSFETVVETDSVSGLSLASAAGTEWLGYVSDFDDTKPWKLLDKPAADGRREPLRAELGVLRAAVPASVGSKAAPLSLRAHSAGGVALAPGDAARGDFLMAWSGLDGGVPQLFVTQFDKNGAKLAQRMLTHKKGELSSIALCWVGDGWVVAWVDGRHGDPEVYATKIDAKLNRTAPEQRITSAQGAAADLSLSFDGKQLRLAWSDARGAGAEEHADIYSARLRPRDAAREGNELRVTPTRSHSFSPSLYPHGNGFALAWIEGGDEAGGGRVLLSDISPDGSPGPLTTLALPESTEPRALSLDCPSSCRVLVIGDGREQSQLFAAPWNGAELGKVSLLRSFARSNGGVAPALRGDVAWVAERGTEGTKIRRLQLQW